MQDVIYDGDERYPGPAVFPLPDFVSGTPTQAELDAQPRLFTWGETKEIIKSGELEHLSRNKELQARYEKWMAHQKEIWGSTESYLVNARLPWANMRSPIEPTYDQRTALDHPEVDLTPSTNPNTGAKKAKRTSGSGAAAVAAHALGRDSPLPPSAAGAASGAATAASTPGGSGASTPTSAAYVSLDSVLPRVNRALARRKDRASRLNLSSSGGSSRDESGFDPEDPAHDVFLRWEGHLDPEKYAVLPNDWPYCIPYGVRHYCIWSRVPIAHPVLVNYDREAWNHVETHGLGGFTGVVPVVREGDSYATSEEERSDDEGNILPAEVPFSPPPSEPPSPTSPLSPVAAPPAGAAGRSGPATAGAGGWYGVDVEFGGREMRRWAGVTYESKGGAEVGRMVRALWDERGWETVWFVNPAHLQSIPGFSHFHVFARRKTPIEIDISEKVHAAREKKRMERAERSKRMKEDGKKGEKDAEEAALADELAEKLEETLPNGVVNSEA